MNRPDDIFILHICFQQPGSKPFNLSYLTYENADQANFLIYNCRKKNDGEVLLLKDHFGHEMLFYPADVLYTAVVDHGKEVAAAGFQQLLQAKVENQIKTGSFELPADNTN